jgi:hypothetical protein
VVRQEDVGGMEGVLVVGERSEGSGGGKPEGGTNTLGVQCAPCSGHSCRRVRPQARAPLAAAPAILSPGQPEL